MPPLALFLLLATPAAAPAPKPLEDCDALYYGQGRPKDHVAALACYRSVKYGWAAPLMVIVMQLNGEGTPVDVAGARAGLQRSGMGGGDIDTLDHIIKERERNPKVKADRVDFCEEVATTTPSLAYCASVQEDGVAAKDDKRLAELRAGLEPGARSAFEAARAAFGSFVAAEGRRVYQKWIEGTIRSEASIAGESFARADFMASIEMLAGAGVAGPQPGKRSFSDADGALNAAYRDELRGYASGFDDQAKGAPATEKKTYQTYVREYKALAHIAQRRWVRYRDAMVKLAAARWPAKPEVEGLTRALVTEDRIHELTPGEGDIR